MAVTVLPFAATLKVTAEVCAPRIHVPAYVAPLTGRVASATAQASSTPRMARPATAATCMAPERFRSADIACSPPVCLGQR